MANDGSRTPGTDASESTEARTELWLDIDFAVEFMTGKGQRRKRIKEASDRQTERQADRKTDNAKVNGAKREFRATHKSRAVPFRTWIYGI